MKHSKFLVTGGTGFLGKFVVPLLREIGEVDVISRQGKTELKGDFSIWNAGLDLEDLKEKKYDAFIHLAGLYDLAASRLDVYRNNVSATSMALKVASALDIGLFVNASTIAAATNMDQETVGPYDVDLTRAFHEPYGESKALVEQQLKHWQSPNGNMKKINLRLGILVGDSKTGNIERLDGPYMAFKSFQSLGAYLKSWKLPLLFPGNPKVRLPFVPVDIAAQAVVGLVKFHLLNPANAEYKSYYVTPKEGLPVLDFYKSIWTHFDLPMMDLSLTHHLPEKLLTEISHRFVGLPEDQLRYALHLPRFDSSDTEAVLGAGWCPEFSDYVETFWSGYEKFVSNR